MLTAVGLSLSLVLAAATSSHDQWKYETLVRCKAISERPPQDASDARSKRAIAKIEDDFAAPSDRRDGIDADVEAKRKELAGHEQFIRDSTWQFCRRLYAPHTLKSDAESDALAKRLSRTNASEDRIAAAKIIEAAPEKYGALLLMLAGEPLMLAGDRVNARFIFHAGIIRASNFLLFDPDREVSQFLSLMRSMTGAAFMAEALLEPREMRLAAERAVAWDRVTPNADVALVLEDTDPAEAQTKMEVVRCYYLASYTFGEATAALEIKERYDGDIAKFRKQLLEDAIATEEGLGDDYKQRMERQEKTARARFGARQTALLNEAKKNTFGSLEAYEQKKKADPLATCDRLLAQAKKLVQ